MDKLTREEIVGSSARTLFELIQRERPRWLQIRGQRSFGSATEIVVYQNQTRLGGIDVLQSIGPGAAWWIEYLDGPTASAMLPGLGSQVVEGAIILHTTAEGER